MLAILKDRLMRTARVHMLHLNRDKKTFYGLVYDNGPLASGGMPYQLLQTTLEGSAMLSSFSTGQPEPDRDVATSLCPISSNMPGPATSPGSA